MPLPRMGLDSEYIDVPYSPTGGVNYSAVEDMLEDGEVFDARNFLFESGMALTRPAAVNRFTLTGQTAASVYQKTFLFAPGSWVYIGLTSDNKVWNLGTQITGAALTLGNPVSHNSALINGVIMLGNNTGGLINTTVPGGTTYTIIATAPFAYVRAHLARAVAAYQLAGGTAATNPFVFAWSVPGDQTTWTGSTNGSGAIIIADADSAITGLEVIHNVAVIPRATGFHLAYPTGVAIPNAFRMETWTKDRIGAPWSSTIATSNNMMFFVGEDDVYTFDLINFKSIGKKIRNVLIPQISGLNNTTQFFKGFVTTRQGNGLTSRYQAQPRLRYHLLQVGANPTNHYIYNVDEGNWSVHQYSFQATAPFDDLIGFGGGPVVFSGPAFVDNSNPGNFISWSNASPCEQASFLTGPVHQVQQREIDVTLQRILVSARDLGATNITVSFVNKLASATGTGSVQKSFGINNDSRLIREWFDFFSKSSQPTGQSFQVTISVPANNAFATNYYNLRFTLGGDFRG